MNQKDDNFCQQHKAREEFVCVNIICIDEQQKLSCYQCLEAQHNNYKHPKEDYISIKLLVEQINKEKEERLIILKNAKQQSLNQKKLNRETFEKSKMVSPQYINEMLSKMDEQYEECCLKIDQKLSCLEDIDLIHPQSLPSLIRLYKQSTKEFSEQIENIKFKPFEYAHQSFRQSETTLIEFQKKIEDQVKGLEHKVNQLSIQNPVQKGRNHFYPAIILSLITIVIIQWFYSPYSKIEIKIQEKFEEAYSECDKLNSELKYSMDQKFEAANSEQNKLNSKLKYSMDQKFEAANSECNKLNSILKYSMDQQFEAAYSQYYFMNSELESLKLQLNDANLEIKELQSNLKKISDSFLFKNWY